MPKWIDRQFSFLVIDESTYTYRAKYKYNIKTLEDTCIAEFLSVALAIVLQLAEVGSFLAYDVFYRYNHPSSNGTLLEGDGGFTG